MATAPGQIKYVKLLDGGLVDNYRLAGFTVARLASETPFGPLAPQEAVRAAALFVHGGQFGSRALRPMGANYSRSDRCRPNHGRLRYRDRGRRGRQLLGLRCDHEGLEKFPGALALRLVGSRSPPLWGGAGVELQRCAVFIGRVGFDGLSPDRAAALNRVETRLKLPPDQVDMLIAAGRDALSAKFEVPRLSRLVRLRQAAGLEADPPAPGGDAIFGIADDRLIHGVSAIVFIGRSRRPPPAEAELVAVCLCRSRIGIADIRPLLLCTKSCGETTRAALEGTRRLTEG